MSTSSYQGLRPHIGHKLECVCYGRDGEDPVNIAIECMDCGMVLVDFEAQDHVCRRCGTDLDEFGRCFNKMCPYSG